MNKVNPMGWEPKNGRVSHWAEDDPKSEGSPLRVLGEIGDR